MTPATPPLDIRLIASDMDGTLLDDDGRIPDEFWPLLDDLIHAGVYFVPASGRQYQTLLEAFGNRDELIYIAENGTNIVRDGKSLALQPVDLAIVAPAVELVRSIASSGADIGIVVCGAKSAYIERADDQFVAQVRRYYAALEIVDDVTVAAAHDDVLKLAIYDFASAEKRSGPSLIALNLHADVVVSGEHWVDVMRPGVNKGEALQWLQQRLGISREQTMAFGDYLNDAELLDAAGHSYAVANAHPSIRARARHVAPSNAAGGVLSSIRDALPGLASPRS